MDQARTEMARLRAMLDEMGLRNEEAQYQWDGINKRANTLSIIYDEHNSAFVRRSAAYDRARRAYQDSQTAARQYHAAL